MFTVGSLFSGIGGLELGLERTGGFKTIWFCENDAYASAVLRKHWPTTPNLGDITKIDWAGVDKPDMLTGGFPCQDISIAGKGKGIEKGERSGLWREYAKAIRILQPRYALIENVPILAKRGLNIVLADLAEMGYDAEWGMLSASSVGALHKRERIFIFAYSNGERSNDGVSVRKCGCVLSDKKQDGSQNKQERNEWKRGINPNTKVTFDKGSERIQRLFKKEIPEVGGFLWCKDIRRIEDIKERPDIPEPLVCRTSDGVPAYVDRIKCLGNSIVPQCAEVIGNWIIEWSKKEGKYFGSFRGDDDMTDIIEKDMIEKMVKLRIDYAVANWIITAFWASVFFLIGYLIGFTVARS